MTPAPSETVALCRCRDYSPTALAAAFDAVLSDLKLPLSIRGATVLLKPNLISSRGPALACTDPRFLAVAAGWFADHGARIRIGDSPAFGTTRSVMERHSMLEPLRGLPVELVQFSTPVARTLEKGVRVEIAAEALECDLLVNLPRLKAHNQMYITAAVKNFFGIVVGMRKAMLHMRQGGSHHQFADILLSLPELVKPHFSLVDGIEVMHRSGPLDGEPLGLRCIAGSHCPVALDTALLHLLELPAGNSPLWRAAAARHHPGSRGADIRYLGAGPDDFRGAGFIAPSSLNPIRFSLLRLLAGAARRLALAIRP